MKNFFLILSASVLFGCSKGPKPIAYGEAECTFCKMTIMDKRFGCQLVNTKGKPFSFDDLSCMVGYLKTEIISQKDKEGMYVPDYLGANTLLPAKSLHFVASETLRSPMGGNIAGFSMADSAKAYAEKLNGKLVTWNDIVKHD